DFGTEQAQLATSDQRSLSEKVAAFFVSVYESGIDARGYQNEAQQLVVHHKKNNSIQSVRLGTNAEYGSFCNEANYRFVNDSIVEVKGSRPDYLYQRKRYDFETSFIYHQIAEDGTISLLRSNRYFDFTKFILIDENHLKGCFAWQIEDPSAHEGQNMWVADHLSIEDLDIMRNEIFAEYGYKFKTEKWQKYFSKQSWYQPKYDDVNDLLTDIDKANVQFILEMKEKLKDNEDNYRNKRSILYVAAG
ncbi:MAG: YARHG domain-containing protein, partial [Bacteroidota bacterium]